MLEKLFKLDCGGDTEDFRLTCELIALLVHKSTTYVRFPKCKTFQNNLAFLADVTENIAAEAPSVQRLCFGDSESELCDVDLMSKSRFLRQITRMRNLRVLDAMAFHCDSNSLAFIASNMTLLT
jgi:hypothetical protein